MPDVVSDALVAGRPTAPHPSSSPPAVSVVHSTAADGPVITVRVVGEFDHVTSRAVWRAWSRISSLFRGHLHWALEEVTFCNLAGLRTLLGITERHRRAGGTVGLGTSEIVERLIGVVGVGDRLVDQAAPEEAVRDGGQRPSDIAPSMHLGGAVAGVVSASVGDHQQVVDALVVAAAGIAGVDSVHVTLTARRGVRASPASAGPLGQGLGDAELRVGEGPGAQSRRDGAVVDVPDLHAPRAGEEWPRLLAAVHGLPVRSVLCLDLAVPGRQLGTLTLSSAHPGVFGAAHRDAGAVLAAVAALALAAEDERRQLREALVHRDVIGQAKGIFMAQRQLTAQGAFDVLRRASSEYNTKLHVIAETVAATGELGTGLLPAPVPGTPHRRRSRHTGPFGEVAAGTGTSHGTCGG